MKLILAIVNSDDSSEVMRALTKDGVQLGCATICINPSSLELVSKMVEGTDTGICVVCDFPFGLSTTESKAKTLLQCKSKIYRIWRCKSRGKELGNES